MDKEKLVEFTPHALVKMQVLRDHGVEVTKELLEHTVRAPEFTEPGYGGRIIAQAAVDDSHVLRVVYEETGAGAVVVTMYPGRRIRYEKNEI
jgi:hypothetical protein